MGIAALDIAPPPLSPQARPLKRRFTEMDDNEEETLGSDELYGWEEDDTVAAEGLLIKENSTHGDVCAAASRTDDTAERQKVTRPATL
jgi:hypothetical protein